MKLPHHFHTITLETTIVSTTNYFDSLLAGGVVTVAIFLYPRWYWCGVSTTYDLSWVFPSDHGFFFLFIKFESENLPWGDWVQYHLDLDNGPLFAFNENIIQKQETLGCGRINNLIDRGYNLLSTSAIGDN